MRTCSWRIELSLIPANDAAEPDGHIGRMGPYAILYEALDKDQFQREIRNATCASGNAVGGYHATILSSCGERATSGDGVRGTTHDEWIASTGLSSGTRAPLAA